MDEKFCVEHSVISFSTVIILQNENCLVQESLIKQIWAHLEEFHELVWQKEAVLGFPWHCIYTIEAVRL